MATFYELEAMHMFTRAELERTDDGVRVLAADLKSLADDELDAEYTESALAYQAATILKQRIGGLVNLRSYVDVLLAGDRRRRGVK